MIELIRYLEKIAMLTVLTPLKLMPTKKNRVIMDNSLSHNYADNIKPIGEYLTKNYPGKFDIYLCVNDESKFEYLKEKGITPIRFHSFKYYKTAMSSAFYISNSGGYSYLPLKKNQYVINTWHGGGAYKKFGIDSFSADKFYRNDLKLSAKKTNMFISSSERFTDVVSNALLIPKDRFNPIGMPRNDILVNGDDEKRNEVRKKLGLKDDEKLVLYAPTFRRMNDDTFSSTIAINYGIDPETVCKALSTRFGGNWKFGVRLHPTVKDIDEFRNKDVLNLTVYDDMQELLLASDCLITDFSSSMWDYILTGKPGFLFARDLKHYIETTAVYTPLNEWPFEKSESNEELEKIILEFNPEKYKEACNKHYNDFKGCETGKATEIICKFLVDKIK